ncbi:hypothetical protein D1632_05460 [Chryseobacterium nematophagum]|uniref:DNA-directed RNA polymerase n=1 Tax=Chryseobacterium nematophagum TaxID=2305228 RepID=A0A3M7LE71_9FLAO|nr:hypothetical protein [Chryseobacterium nematophagum]RMZ60385.1 hypothetical protein D1632_05460 [Chryseobacterium nematophagum]
MAQELTPKSLTLYIPQNFDIDKLITNNPPNFKYQKDHFIYLVHLITEIPNRNKNIDMFYIPFYSSLIQRRVREYRKYLNYLVDNKVFVEDRQYIVGKKSRGFRFHVDYQTEIKPTHITNKPLIKSILNFIHLDNADNNSDEIIPKDAKELDYLLKWFNGKLTVDFIGAKKYLFNLYEIEKKCHNVFTSDKPCSAMARFNSRYMVLLKLKRQEFIHTVDSTAGRLHTILTQLKGDLRQFITYDNKSLVAIDITNSQPYLSTVLFNEEKFKENNILSTVKLYNKSYLPKDDIQTFLPYYVNKNVKKACKSENVNHYMDIVKSGQLYEEFGKILLNKGIITDETCIRKQAKTIIFSSIFSPNQSIAYNQSMVIFKDLFPDVYEIYRQIKQGEHRTLACLLQNIEAKLVLHTACKIIAEEQPEVPIFTLHDSIITTSGNEQYVYKILYDVLLNAIGIPPSLKFERWEKVA